MKQKPQRISVFCRADNAPGYVQAVISSADAEHFYRLGFGPSPQDLPEPELPEPELPEPELPEHKLPEPEPEPEP